MAAIPQGGLRDKDRRGPRARRLAAPCIRALLCMALALSLLSCLNTGNATQAQRDELLQAVREYWGNQRDYNPGTTTGVGEITYAEVEGDEAKVRVEITLGYVQPTEGAGYKETTFLLRREGDAWRVTYDGWIGREIQP